MEKAGNISRSLTGEFQGQVRRDKQQYINNTCKEIEKSNRQGRIRDLYQKVVLGIANLRWLMERAREYNQHIYFCFIDYSKAFDCVDHVTL